MQQRPTAGLSRAALPDQDSPRMVEEFDFSEDSHLPLYFRHGTTGPLVKRDSTTATTTTTTSTGDVLQPRSSRPDKWVHLIPLAVLLCLFFLWCFSYPVNLEMMDGKIVAIHRIETPAPPADYDNYHVELAILAAASTISPVASPPVNLTTNTNQTEGRLAAVNITG